MEVAESIEVLAGGGPSDLRDLCLTLAAWMFYLGERVKTLDEGKKLSADLIASGQAREKFREIVGLQGGDVGVVDDPHRLAHAGGRLSLSQFRRGIRRCNSVRTTWRCRRRPGGRPGKKEDKIDPAVGLEFHKRIGDPVERGEPLCTMHYNSDARLAEAQILSKPHIAFALKTKFPSSAHLSSDRRIGRLNTGEGSNVISRLASLCLYVRHVDDDPLSRALGPPG